MGSGGKSKSKSSSAPWKAQQPYLKELYSRAQGLLNQGPYEYGPSRYVPFSEESEESFEMARNRARGTELRGANVDLTQRTLRGEFLDPSTNPALAGMERDATRSFYGGIQSLGSSMASAGRAGGGAHGRGAARAEENLATGLGDARGRLYSFERGMQGQAQQTALQLGQEGWRDINAMRSIGQQKEANEMTRIQDMVARFQQGQYSNAEKIAEFANMIGAPVASSKSKSSSFSASIG